MDRRTFLKRLGLAVGVAASAPILAKLPAPESKDVLMAKQEVDFVEQPVLAVSKIDVTIRPGDIISINGEEFVVTSTCHSSNLDHYLELDVEVASMESNSYGAFSYYVGNSELVVRSKRMTSFLTVTDHKLKELL